VTYYKYAISSSETLSERKSKDPLSDEKLRVISPRAANADIPIADFIFNYKYYIRYIENSDFIRV